MCSYNELLVGLVISDQRRSQCSVLGPLLCLVYINDVQFTATSSNVFLFADDINVAYESASFEFFSMI